MKIREIRAVGLRGASPEGGWAEEILPDDCIHTLVAVLTDEGVTGYGGVFRFGSDGSNQRAYTVYEVQPGGGRKVVSPSPTSFGGA